MGSCCSSKKSHLFSQDRLGVLHLLVLLKQRRLLGLLSRALLAEADRDVPRRPLHAEVAQIIVSGLAVADRGGTLGQDWRETRAWCGSCAAAWSLEQTGAAHWHGHRSV